MCFGCDVAGLAGDMPPLLLASTVFDFELALTLGPWGPPRIVQNLDEKPTDVDGRDRVWIRFSVLYTTSWVAISKKQAKIKGPANRPIPWFASKDDHLQDQVSRMFRIIGV
jgi:hypothetical protein